MSDLSLNNKYITEALSPEQRKKAQEILNKETGADKKIDADAERRKRAEIRKEKELELKQANLEIRKRREDRRDQGAKDREKNKAEKEKRDALKAKQRDLAKKVGEKSKEAASARSTAKAATKKSYERITDKDGDATALAKLGSNVAKGTAGQIGNIRNRLKARRLQKQADATQKKLDKTKEVKEETTMKNVSPKDKKVIQDRGKNLFKKDLTGNVTNANEAMENPQVDSQKKKQDQIKKRVLMAKLRAVRSGGGESITASYDPEFNMITEVDEVESKDKKADKVIDIMKGKNKIEVNPQIKAEGVIDAVKAGAKRHSKAIEKKKIKNRKAVPYAALAAETQPEGEMVEDYYKGTGEKVQKRTLAWMKKKGQKGAPGLDAMKAREAEHKAKRGVKEEVVDEAKVEKNRSDYGKASVRNKRKFGKEGEPAIFDTNSERGKMIDQRRAEHKARRGVKEDWKPEIEHSKLGDAKKKADKKRESKLPPHLQGDAIGKMRKAFASEENIPRNSMGKPIRIKDKIKAAKGHIPHNGKPTTEECEISELNRYGKETGKATGSINKRAGTPVKSGGSTDDKALTFVRNMIRKETGKPSGQQKKVKGEKGRSQPGDRKFSPADTIAKVRQSKKDADSAMRDTRGT